jgi:acetyl-CoA C-acetyltransferase
MIDPATPVVIGVGQAIDRWRGDDAATAPSPIDMAVRAGAAALADSECATIADAVDRVVAIRTMADSLGGGGPFGRCANPPGTIAARLGVVGANHVYSVTGGDQPQALLTEAAAAVHAGEARAVLIVGGEATAAMKFAARAGTALDWSASVEGDFEDRGTGAMLLTPYEIANGLGMPVTTYPLFDNALRARHAMDRATWRAAAAAMLAPMSRVASANPFAQFREAWSADDLARPSAANYPVADPYLRGHVAQDAVNQGAAAVVTTVGTATALGVDPAKFVYLHGAATLTDAPVLQRPDLSRSRAIASALTLALEAAGKSVSEIAHLDLYSCFPCAVMIAAESMGIDPAHHATTLTGGLPFFGGPGNNYALHAIAEAVARCRAAPTSFVLVHAIGGFLSKAAVGIYAAVPPSAWAPGSSTEAQRALNVTDLPEPLSADAEGKVESYTVTMAKGAPANCAVVALTPRGRILARVSDAALLGEILDSEPVGRRVGIRHTEGRNRVTTLD